MAAPLIAWEGGVNLASERLGARVLGANDDFFAPKENLLKDATPVWDADRYVETGKWMDGWETRRRRDLGPTKNDWCLLRLAYGGRIREVIVDTAHFTGNFPESCSLEATTVLAQGTETSIEELNTAEWTEILPRQILQGDAENRFPIDSPYRWTHLRLRIYPDGGVARLRVVGEIIPAVAEIPAGLFDLASLAHGAAISAASDRFYSAPEKALLPDEPQGMFDGWETRRRRGPGNDWICVRLAAEGVIESAEIDTRFFKGNAPGEGSLEGLRQGPGAAPPDPGGDGWKPLLRRTPLRPHHRHPFPIEEGAPVTHVRLQIYPDGGLARLRLPGRLTEDGRRAVALRDLNTLPPTLAAASFLACCGAHRWAREMAAARPFSDLAALRAAAEGIADTLHRDDWLEAFAAHPRIGEKKAARATGAQAAAWSDGEQEGTHHAPATVLERLAAGNRAYEERFGFLYLVCATGKSAEALLALLEERLGHTPETEFPIAVAEQRKITALRLEKLVTPTTP